MLRGLLPVLAFLGAGLTVAATARSCVDGSCASFVALLTLMLLVMLVGSLRGARVPVRRRRDDGPR